MGHCRRTPEWVEKSRPCSFCSYEKPRLRARCASILISLSRSLSQRVLEICASPSSEIQIRIRFFPPRDLAHPEFVKGTQKAARSSLASKSAAPNAGRLYGSEVGCMLRKTTLIPGERKKTTGEEDLQRVKGRGNRFRKVRIGAVGRRGGTPEAPKNLCRNGF